MKFTAWRAAVRIARRDAMRAKGRSALVLAMIALPVLGVAGADVVYRSASLTPAEKAVRLMGRADAVVDAYERGATVVQLPNAGEGATADPPAKSGPTPEQLRSATVEPADLIKQLLPAGSVLVPTPDGQNAVAGTRDGQLRVQVSEADLGDPVWHGKADLVRGRAPSAPQELAATQAFLDAAHLKLGDTTTLRGLEGKPYTITAVVERPGDLGANELIGRPGALVGPVEQASGMAHARDNDPFGSGRWLVELPAGATLDWAKVQDLNKYGFAVTSRSVLLAPPPDSQVPYLTKEQRFSSAYLTQTNLVIVATVAGLALLEIVLLAGPAFAVGARRSRRQLGLIAAGGGERSHIRAVVLGGGLVLGLAGAVTGVLLGIALVAATRPWLEELAERRFGHFALQPLDLLGVAAIGLVTGLLAAIVPAVQAARQDVLASLTGRGPLKPPGKRLAVLGLVMLAGGAALALFGTVTGIGGQTTVLLGGSAVAELGVVLCTPVLIGLFAKLGRYLPLSPRLALRDAVRHRGRTAPAVAAVLAAVAGSVAVGIYGTSSDEESRQNYVAQAPSGAVQLMAGWGAGRAAEVPGLRAAVEQSMPGLGRRGDIGEVGYRNGAFGNSGYLKVLVPQERRCPVLDLPPGQPRPDQAVFENTMRTDPRCKSSAYNVQGGRYGSVPAGDATTLHNLTGATDPAAERALAGGKMLVFDPVFLKDGKITLELNEPVERTGPVTALDLSKPSNPVSHQVSVDAVLMDTKLAPGTAFMTPDTAKRLGLDVTAAGAVWLPDAPPSDSAEQRATAAVGKLSVNAMVEVERGYRVRNDLVTMGLTGFAALVALGAAGIATGLAAADSQQDLATLAAVGANAGIRRRLSGFQCAVIAAMGCVLGTVCGFIPAVALRKFSAQGAVPPGSDRVAHMVLAVPWLNLGLTLVALPVLAGLLAMAFTRSRLGLQRRSA